MYKITSSGNIPLDGPYQIQADGSRVLLQQRDTGPVEAPDPPTVLSSSAFTDSTHAHLDWAAPTGTTVKGYEVSRDSVFVARVSASTLTYPFTVPNDSLPHVFSVATVGVSRNSAPASVTLQWNTAPPTRPTPPSGLIFSSVTATSATLSWVEGAVPSGSPAIAGHRAYRAGGVLMRDVPGGTLRSMQVTGLTQGTTYSGVYVTRYDTAGVESNPSNTVTFTTLTSTNPQPVTMLMGCSASPNDHGGTEVWDGWRVYDDGKLMTLANRTGSQRPKFLAYSKNGSPFSGSYASIRQEVLDDLNTFYYTGGATSQTHSARWGIKLYWSNGNENTDKGIISCDPSAPPNPHTATQIANYTTSMRALYDAVHYVDPSTGQRRFPDAYAGSDPTQNHEQKGWVADVLTPTAQYHDFVAWSMYPPGRQSTNTDPTYNWPSYSESRKDDLQDGFLIRCFYRTKQIEAAARSQLGNPGFRMQIHCWEVGIAADPGDSTTRPYYAVHGLAGSMWQLARQYDFDIPVACWWDNETGPANILSDEPSTTSPSTRVAWQNWPSYDPRVGGTHPASWAGNPKTSGGSAWKMTGTPV